MIARAGCVVASTPAEAAELLEHYRADPERLRGVKVGDILRADEGVLLARRKVLSHFVMGNDGEFLEPEAALVLLDDMTIEQHEGVWEAFLAAIQAAAGTGPK